MNINIANLGVKIGKKQILKNINFEVINQEFVGIIGPNGSGKSTLLKSIYRVLKPSKGDIFLNDVNLNQLSLRESARQIAVVAQQDAVVFDFSVLEIVLMGRTPYKKILEMDNEVDIKIAKAALDNLGLADFEDRLYSTLSGGEQQRVLLARALVQEAQCLILDEPTNHLDIMYQFQLMNHVKKLKITVLAALHDLDIATLYCDKILALKNGEVFAWGPPEEVLTEENIFKIFQVKSEVIKSPKTNKIHIHFTNR